MLFRFAFGKQCVRYKRSLSPLLWKKASSSSVAGMCCHQEDPGIKQKAHSAGIVERIQ